MARKQDTRTIKMPGRKKPAKGEARADPKIEARADAKAPPPKSAVKAKRGKAAAKVETAKAEEPKAKAKTRKAAPNSRKPAPPAARMPVLRVTSAPATAKQALKSARAQAKALVAEIPVPPSPPQVSDSVRAIGNQIASWLHSELGRAMLAELLVYVARQISTAVEKTAEEVEEPEGAPPPAPADAEEEASDPAGTGAAEEEEKPVAEGEGAGTPPRKGRKGAGKTPRAG